jgi:hypothetical protein
MVLIPQKISLIVVFSYSTVSGLLEVHNRKSSFMVVIRFEELFSLTKGTDRVSASLEAYEVSDGTGEFRILL